MRRSNSNSFPFRTRRRRAFVNPRACFARSAAAGLAIVALFVPEHASSDEIVLKNGKVIEGSTRRTGSRVAIRPWDSDVSIFLDESLIDTIIPKDPPQKSSEPITPEGSSGGSHKPAFQRPAAHDAANTPMERPAIPASQIEPLPKVSFTFDPPPSPQVQSNLETVFPRMMNVYVNELGLKFKGEIKLDIQCFDDLVSFNAHKNQNSDLHYAVEAYYAVADDKIVVWKNQFDQRLAANIYHEGTHAILRKSLTVVPPWIDEGLAEYFEGLRIQGNTTMVLSPQYNDGWAERFLLEDKMIPLENFLRMSSTQWAQLDQQTQNLPRIMSWSVISYLMESETGRRALRRYLDTYKETPPSDALTLAYQEFSAAYPGGVTRLDRDWRRWILAGYKAHKL